MRKKKEGEREMRDLRAKCLMKLCWSAVEGIPDEAVLVSFRRNEGNAGNGAVSVLPG